MENYSVLMSVYEKADPVHFEAAMQSILAQTVPTNDFVIVCDGPLTPALSSVLARYDRSNPGVFQIVQLPENVGIGAAANIGLKHCKNDLVAKMDADDIAIADRCERQLEQFQQNPDLIVLGGYIEEFDEDPNCPFSIRSVPESNEEIRKFARRRQPFNNMTVMYRQSAVHAVGGYRSFRRSEDYDLYLRLLQNGYLAGNIPQILVKARVNRHAHARRASWSTLKGCAESRWYAFRIGYSSFWDFLICVTGELVIFISPNKVQQMLYSRFLRKSVENQSDSSNHKTPV